MVAEKERVTKNNQNNTYVSAYILMHIKKERKIYMYRERNVHACMCACVYVCVGSVSRNLSIFGTDSIILSPIVSTHGELIF